MSTESDLLLLQQRVIKFRDDRNWKQFHNPKDVAISLLVEASELLDVFKWKNEKEISSFIASNKQDITNEIMDVLYHVLLLSADMKINIVDEFERKMKINEDKYPLEKSKGSNKKYTEL